ncbi:MAG: tannase/feruloyl esterase family alpha/beta hydrolase, partial [Hyphomicrobium sp.]
MIARFILLALFAFATSAAHAASCGDVVKLTLPNVSVTSASLVAAGAFTPPATPGKPVTVTAFCRIELRVTPTPDSQIGIEVWTPEGSAWNGKLLGIGNGGYSSLLDYPAMAEGLRGGYAVVATDQGHQGDDLWFVVGHPGKIDDWADRAIHVMTTTAKLVVRDMLGRFPDRTYFNGCSTGGFQGMAETQRYPDDYDGVVAGAPGYPRLNLSASFLAAWAVNHDANGTEILPLSKLPMLNKAAIDACGADGVIEDPRACHFDPAALLCKAADGPECLTAAQVGVVRAIYAGPRTPRTAEPVFPGWDPGSEAPGGNTRLGWTAYIVGQPEPVRLELWKYWLFGDPAFDWRSFDLGRDLTAANALLPVMNATSPHLDAFRAHGGKLLMYHGWADNVSSARGTIDYYDSVPARRGRPSQDASVLPHIPCPGDGALQRRSWHRQVRSRGSACGLGRARKRHRMKSLPRTKPVAAWTAPDRSVLTRSRLVIEEREPGKMRPAMPALRDSHLPRQTASGCADCRSERGNEARRLTSDRKTIATSRSSSDHVAGPRSTDEEIDHAAVTTSRARPCRRDHPAPCRPGTGRYPAQHHRGGAEDLDLQHAGADARAVERGAARVLHLRRDADRPCLDRRPVAAARPGRELPPHRRPHAGAQAAPERGASTTATR